MALPETQNPTPFESFYQKRSILLIIISASIFATLLAALFYLSKHKALRGTFPTDTRIVVTNGGNYAYENVINDFKSEFKTKATDIDGIVFSNALGKIAFYTPANQSFGTVNSNNTPVTEGSTITYPNIFNQMDLKYTVSTSRLLEEFIIKDPATAKIVTKIEQRAKTDSGYTQNKDGSITFSNSAKTVFTLPHPVMYEVGNQDEKSTGIVYEIKKGQTEFTITKVLTPEGKTWLADKNRKYPIAIDLVIDNADTYSDWVSSDNTNTTVSQDTSIKQEGSGSVKVQTSSSTSPTTFDLMEYSSDGNAQAVFVTNDTSSATGGTVTTSGGNTIHRITSSGNFVASGALSINYLLVGGGGSGVNGSSNNGGGGGGGGQMVTGSTSIAVGTYPVVIGAGGGNSSFNSVTALKGSNGSGGTGGANGGATHTGGTGGLGGGGGAGAGANGSSSGGGFPGGAGGAGTANSISGSSVTYAGGGGGGSFSQTPGAGGTGGGGRGGNDAGTAAVAGTANTGGGGGGAANTAVGSGGSGVVIISYPTSTLLQSYSESTIKSQGTYALKGIAGQTTSLNKTLTRTISSPIDLSNATNVTFDIRSTRTGSNIKVGLHDSGGTTTEVTPNITSANAFQTGTIDLSAVTNANKDAIDQIIVTIVEATAANTFYIDNMNANYPLSLNDTVTRTTAPTDLSAEANLTYWVRSSVAGTYATFGFGEASATEQTNTITINQADTWEQKVWDISGISAAARNAVTRFAFTFTANTSNAAFYFDDIQTNTLFAPTLGAGTSLTDSSIRWNFTDNSTVETGFKIYDSNSSLLVTCATTNIASCDEAGLTPNTQYTRKIGTYNSTATTINSGTVSAYTLATVPSTPTVNTRTATTVQVNPDPSTNPAGTLMAIYKETATTCDGSGGNYLAADGSSNGSTAVWQSDATWATVTATGLSSETAYTFCVKAKNANSVETGFSTIAGANDSGYIPVAGDFISTATTTAINKYVDGNNPSRYVFGLDAGSGTTNSSVFEARSGIFTINANETLATGSINLTGGSIAIADGGTIEVGSPLWAIDADADGYTADTKLYYGTQPANGRRKYLLTSLATTDCSESIMAPNNKCVTVLGGTIATASGYTVHTFTGNANLLVVAPQGLAIDYLLVGGGGSGAAAGGTNGGGGGGGGQMVTGSTSVSTTTYPIVIGAGGGNSSFNSVIAVKGSNGSGGTGGTSGGGGHAGGAGTLGGGGGGGAGANGSSNAGGFPGGAGGAGTASSISGSSVTYAGGGGGGSFSQTPGAGGAGGGGRGGNDAGTASVAGTANTGGGGGGTSNTAVGAGGSGIVIIRYLTP